MATNPYFNQICPGTQELIDDLKREVIQAYGQDMKYIIRDESVLDLEFGEDVLNTFRDNYTIEMYIETVEEFGGQKEVFAKFGFEINDKTEMSVNATRFTEVTGQDKPEEGDLVYWPLVNKLFVITFVDLDKDFYELGQNYNYLISMDLFSFAQEDFDTGITEVDGLNDLDITEPITLEDIDSDTSELDDIDFTINNI